MENHSSDGIPHKKTAPKGRRVVSDAVMDWNWNALILLQKLKY